MSCAGKLEVAQQIANHESPRTTKLYDRRQDEISLDEIERIAIWTTSSEKQNNEESRLSWINKPVLRIGSKHLLVDPTRRFS
jgi:hypothetical protein